MARIKASKAMGTTRGKSKTNRLRKPKKRDKRNPIGLRGRNDSQ